MPIDVVCPGCLARFKVGDQHAGKAGLCPKCKHEIKVPSLKDQVVIHVPDDAMGPKDAKGRPVLKPVAWSELKVPPVAWIVAGAATLAIFAIAYVLRSPLVPDSPASGAPLPPVPLGHNAYFLGIAAMLLGPPLAWLGYLIFRDEEYAGYEGSQLMLRTGACGLGHALLWGLYAIVVYSLLEGEPPSLPVMTLLGPLLIGGGMFVSFVSLDLDWGAAFLHYSLFLVVTILLRLTLGLGAF